MTCGLVHASYSLPARQAVKLTFFAPSLRIQWTRELFVINQVIPKLSILFSMGALHNKWYKCHKMLLTLSHKILPTIILLKSTPLVFF